MEGRINCGYPAQTMLAVSVDILVSLIATACVVVSIAANRFMRPLGALVTATLAGMFLTLLIYTAPRFLSEGWRGFADDASHAFGWLVAFAISCFFAGVVTLIVVAVRRLRRAG